MTPSLVSVFLDYQCNFSCTHCSVGSSPKTRFPMPTSLLDIFFDQLSTLSSIKVVTFTGGEATLHLDMLKSSISRAKQHGKVTRVVSNGWWAKSDEAALAFLHDLQKAGLDEINTSFDDYRLPFIKFSKIVHLVSAAIKLGIRVGVGAIKSSNSSEWCAERIRNELAKYLSLPLSELSKHVSVVSDYPTPSGSGEDLDVAGLDGGLKTTIGCGDLMSTISLHPNGSIKACCGHIQFYAKDLEIGNLYHESLSDIVNRARRNTLLWLIHTLGPKKILEDLGYVTDRYTSKCHACKALLLNHRQEFISWVQSNPDKLFTEKVLLGPHLKRTIEMLREHEQTIYEQLGIAKPAEEKLDLVHA